MRMLVLGSTRTVLRRPTKTHPAVPTLPTLLSWRSSERADPGPSPAPAPGWSTRTTRCSSAGRTSSNPAYEKGRALYARSLLLRLLKIIPECLRPAPAVVHQSILTTRRHCLLERLIVKLRTMQTLEHCWDLRRLHSFLSLNYYTNASVVSCACTVRTIVRCWSSRVSGVRRRRQLMYPFVALFASLSLQIVARPLVVRTLESIFHCESPTSE